MATFGTLAEFSVIVKDWSSYYERREFYFVANKIDSAETKRAVFLSIVGPKTHHPPTHPRTALTKKTHYHALRQNHRYAK